MNDNISKIHNLSNKKMTASGILTDALRAGYEDVVVVGRSRDDTLSITSSHDRDTATSWELRQADDVVRGLYKR